MKKLKNIVFILVSMFIFNFFTGCYDEYINSEEDTWTIFIYLCGSDLESESMAATYNLEEIKQAYLGDNINVIIETGGASQWYTSEIENDKNASIDESAQPSAEMLSELLALLSDDYKIQRILRDFGYFIGRWIYLIDACDDLDKDIKGQNFNPFLINYKDMIDDEDISKHLNQVLNQTLYRANIAYNLLPIYNFKNILDNIMNLGLPDIQKQILFDRKERK